MGGRYGFFAQGLVQKGIHNFEHVGRGLDILFAQARKHCHKELRHTSLNQDYELVCLLLPHKW